jgi:hypothetical protein
MTDPIRDKLWADVYAMHAAKGRCWFQCKDEADRAVHMYDRRPAITATKESP